MFMYHIRYKSTVRKRRYDATIMWNYHYPKNKIADATDVEIVKFQLIEVTD